MFLTIALAAMMGSATAAAESPAPVEVMVLGTFHFDNPGLDLNNVQADDMRKPQRQKELEALAQALAEFRPTKIMVERVAPAGDLIDTKYASFTATTLAENRNERVQIGYRLAARLGHRQVYAIDEQPKAGEPDYFPFEALSTYAAANGMQPRIDAVMKDAAAWTRWITEEQKTKSIAEVLIALNDRTSFDGNIRGYYAMLGIGDADKQPGAELNAGWYLRNAKIFAKLMKVAEPGDRVLAVFGSGHGYWLRHFASETPGYRNVDPVPYLRKAAARGP